MLSPSLKKYINVNISLRNLRKHGLLNPLSKNSFVKYALAIVMVIFLKEFLNILYGHHGNNIMYYYLLTLM